MLKLVLIIFTILILFPIPIQKIRLNIRIIIGLCIIIFILQNIEGFGAGIDGEALRNIASLYNNADGTLKVKNLEATGNIETTGGEIISKGDITTSGGKITATGDITTSGGKITSKGNITSGGAILGNSLRSLTELSVDGNSVFANTHVYGNLAIHKMSEVANPDHYKNYPGNVSIAGAVTTPNLKVNNIDGYITADNTDRTITFQGNNNTGWLDIRGKTNFKGNEVWKNDGVGNKHIN